MERLLLFALIAQTLCAAGAPAGTREAKFDDALSQWCVEQMPGGSVTARDGILEIKDVGGATIWLREQLVAPVEISYDAMVVKNPGTKERVSDLNCFWMARDPKAEGDIFAPGNKRTGEFSTYDNLETYYVGCGGNNNTTTRFRRYDGTGARPLLPENDLHDPKVLLEANRWYHITLTAREGRAEFIRDGARIFTYNDPKFLATGWFGIRTVASHLQIRAVKISSAPAPSSPGR